MILTGQIPARSYSKSDVDGRTDPFGPNPVQGYEVMVKAAGETVIKSDTASAIFSRLLVRNTPWDHQIGLLQLSTVQQYPLPSLPTASLR